MAQKRVFKDERVNGEQTTEYYYHEPFIDMLDNLVLYRCGFCKGIITYVNPLYDRKIKKRPEYCPNCHIPLLWKNI